MLAFVGSTGKEMRFQPLESTNCAETARCGRARQAKTNNAKLREAVLLFAISDDAALRIRQGVDAWCEPPTHKCSRKLFQSHTHLGLSSTETIHIPEEIWTHPPGRLASVTPGRLLIGFVKKISK